MKSALPDGYHTMMVFNSKTVSNLQTEVVELRAEIKALTEYLNFILPKVSKFVNYPMWLTKKQALEICSCSPRKLQDHVKDGLIRTVTVSERGDRAYLKQDCITLPQHIEQHLKGEFKPLPKIGLNQKDSIAQ